MILSVSPELVFKIIFSLESMLSEPLSYFPLKTTLDQRTDQSQPRLDRLSRAGTVAKHRNHSDGHLVE